MSKLKKINWAKIYIFCTLLFYFVLSIITFYIYHTRGLDYDFDDKYVIYDNVYYLSIILFSMISFFVYLFTYLFTLFNKKKKNIYSKQYDLLAIKKFYLVQLGFFLVIVMLMLPEGSEIDFPVIFTSFFVVVMYYYYFYGKSLLEKRTINYLRLKKLFLIMELFFSYSLIFCFKIPVIFSLIILAINCGSTLFLNAKDIRSVKIKRFINKKVMSVICAVIVIIYVLGSESPLFPINYSFNALLLCPVALLFLTNNRLIAKFYDKNSDSEVLEHPYR